MMEVLYFALKGLVVLLVLGGFAVLIAILAARATQGKSELEVTALHRKFQDYGFFLKTFLLGKQELKAELKKQKEEEKKRDKESAEAETAKKVFVIEFRGDIHASDVDNLREEVTAVLQVATPQDEIVVRVESPGGVVHGYGLAASQLYRIRQKNIPLTVCVDEVAASGGYMMAVVAHKILAAPLAIVGSIGVIAQVPNFNKVLKKFDVDYKEYTAGEFKRTVSLLGEITPQGEQHFLRRLNDTHVLFKNHVQQFRPQLNLTEVATGDHWYGEEALKLGLIDGIMTSDDYLMSFPSTMPILQIKYEAKKPWSEKLSGFMGKHLEKALIRVLTTLEKRFFF